MSPAERLRARLKPVIATGQPMPEFRPWWHELMATPVSDDPAEADATTTRVCREIVDRAAAGEEIPYHARKVAEAYLAPKHYRADRDRARTHDPATSQDAANSENRSRRARTQAHELLKAYAHVADLDAALTAADRPKPGIRSPYYGGLTAPEAALIIGKPGAWRRTPELHQDGLLEPIPWSEYAGPKPADGSAGLFPEMAATRETVYGQQARVFRITALGRDELRRMNADEREYKRNKAAREGARGKRA
jgi:hypothetical protein